MEQIQVQLSKLKLSGMASCWSGLRETKRLHDLSLNDGLSLLLQAEEDQRRGNPQQRLLKNAGFRYQASMEEVIQDPGRGIDPGKLSPIAMGRYIQNGESILITGSAGSGKSFLAIALGIHACKQGYTVAYFNMQKLLMRLKVARLEGNIIRLFEKIAKTQLLVIDDFGMTTLEGQAELYLMAIIEDRHTRQATIIASQLPVASWFDLFKEATLADTILDRITHTSHLIEMKVC